MRNPRSISADVIRVATACVMCAVVTCVSAHAEEPNDGARIAPVGTGFYVELNNLAELRRDIEADPLFKYLRNNLPAPAKQSRAWLDIQQQMQMTGDEIFDRYLGQSMVLIAQHAGDNPPGVLLSRVSEADTKLAVERLDLQPAEDSPVGPFRVYRTTDSRTGIAISDKWMAMGDRRHGAYIRPIFESIGQGDKLADDPYFKTWTGMLPAERFGTVFARTPEHDEFHALGLTRNGLDVALHYAGQTPDATSGFGKLGNAPALAFGPLPMSTVAAITLNVYDRAVDPNVARAVDAVLAPRTLAGDIVPNIEAPVVLFATRVPADVVTPASGFDVPALGVAIKLRDPAVADDLARLMEAVRVLVNFQLVQQQTPPMDVRLGEHGDSKFMIVDFGAPLVAKTGQASLRGVAPFAYGRVGDWFVLTTHEHAFRECLDTLGSNATRLTESETFKALPLVDAERPIGAAFVRAEPLADMLDSWIAHLRTLRPDAFAEAEQLAPSSPDAKRAKVLTLAAAALRHYNAMTLQARRGDADQIHATAHFDRK